MLVRAVTVISAVSVRSSSKPLTSRFERVSTKPRGTPNLVAILGMSHSESEGPGVTIWAIMFDASSFEGRASSVSAEGSSGALDQDPTAITATDQNGPKWIWRETCSEVPTASAT